jgi:surface polysaccharide O-acyltransferase-like enzyme
MKYRIYFVSIVSVIITFIVVQITGDYENAFSTTNLFVFMYSVGIFCALFNMKIKIGQKLENIIKIMSRLTFGVYIIHPLILDILTEIIPLMNPLLYLILVFALTSSITFAVSYIASKNVITKKLIHM